MSILSNPQVKEYVRDRFGGNASGVPGAPAAMAPNFPYGSMPGSFGYQMGSRIPDALEGRQFLRPVGNFMGNLGRNSLSSMLAGAGAGGAIGLGTGLMNGSDHPMRRAVVGAGLGAGGALLLSKMMEYRDNQLASKSASFYGLPGGPNPIQFVQTRLFGDGTIGPGDKSMLMGMLPNLNVHQVQQLSDTLRGTMGGGAGYLIAKYLFGLGLGGRALAALVGGAAAMFTGGNPRNAFGQRVDTHYDSLGRQRFV